MKKILMFLAVAACAVQAQATISVSFKTIYTGNGNCASYADAPSEYKKKSYYTAYGFTAENMTSLIEGSGITIQKNATSENQETVNAVADWIRNNFATVKERITTTTKKKATFTLNDAKTSYYADFSSKISEERWVLCLFNDGKEEAFRVATIGVETADNKRLGGSTTDAKIGSDDAYYSNTPVWRTMAVPEPTSGLLLLIGVAGLALKRKRLR